MLNCILNLVYSNNDPERTYKECNYWLYDQIIDETRKQELHSYVLPHKCNRNTLKVVEDLWYNGVQMCACSKANSGYFLALSSEQRTKGGVELSYKFCSYFIESNAV